MLIDAGRLTNYFDYMGVKYYYDPDFRNIIDIMNILSDPDLLDEVALEIALEYFYDDKTRELESFSDNLDIMITYLLEFLSMGDTGRTSNTNNVPLYDWSQDFNMIVSPINRILGEDVRGKDYLHWWTFLSAFMEIGECTFNTYVGIRDKLRRGKKLDKFEQKLYNENRDKIILKKKMDSTTQALLDEILGG